MSYKTIVVETRENVGLITLNRPDRHNAFTRAMALELARHRIRVNALAPGYFLTDMNREFFSSEAGKAMIARIPQRRIGDPCELDAPLLLLASDASPYMTGSVLTIDGGHMLSPL